MFFATDEINNNPHLLPNISLTFSFGVELCEDTLGILDKVYSQKNNSWDFINYTCEKERECFTELTGPSWKTSIKLAIHSRAPQVRICNTGCVNNF